MKILQTQLNKASRRAGEEVGFTLTSLLEVKSEEIGEIDSYRGNVAVLILTDSAIGNDVDLDIDDIVKNLPENDLYDNRRTPSQRLRGALYLRLEQKLGRKPEKTEFATYYLNSMNKIISKITEELD